MPPACGCGDDHNRQGSARSRCDGPNGEPAGTDGDGGKRPGCGGLCVARGTARLGDHRQRRLQDRTRAGLAADPKRRSEMDRLASHLDDEQNKRDWKAARPVLDELRGAQEKAEAIAHTLDEQPAAKILATEAAPLAREILAQATSIIDHESTIASTDRRKSLLIGFADTRGSMAMAIGAIRGYLLTGNIELQDRVRATLGNEPGQDRRTDEATVGDDSRSAGRLRRARSPRAPNSRRCRRRCSRSAPRIAGTWRSGS